MLIHPAFPVCSSFYATRMSSLWTPEGEHRVPRDTGPGDAPPGSGRPAPAAASGPTGDAEHEAAIAADLDELRHQLVSTPVEVVVANHAYGLFELAAIHLSERPAGLVPARLAIDALGALVEGLAGRLGEAEASLVDALAQIRLAYVQIQAAHEPGEATDAAHPTDEAGSGSHETSAPSAPGPDREGANG